MANKFTQSVLQRLEQEQKVKPKINTVINNEAAEEKTIATEPASQIVPDVPAENNTPDVSDYLRPDPGRTAKNKTFYLDVEVIDALCSAARRQNVTDSKLCNDILRRVLGVGVTR